MYTFLFTVLVLDALVLVGAILLQSGKGSGLAASFGGASSAADSVIGSRQAGNLLTKASWWAGGIFLGLSFTLQLLGARQRSPRSVLEQTFSAPAPAPAGRAPAPGAAPGAAPAIPLRPATPPAGAPAGTGAAPATPPAGSAPAPR